jgi:ABC-2 type transport system ATP-binding protein
MNIIEVNGLTKRFKDILAVDEVVFSVGQGEIFGFLGPNGAGKTTTINMLCTLLKPTSGTATLNGYDIIKEKNRVRESIGLVFQDPSLDEQLTARENLEFHALIYDVPLNVARERIKEVVHMVGLADRITDKVETFSGGMKRRLEIARGLLHYPKVLFLDEPTLGLDPQTRNHIWEYILDLRRKRDITIFLTTHYMDEAENCDRIAIIDRGRIIALDTPNNLKKSVGGDVITLDTADNEKAQKIIESRFGRQVAIQDGTLRFEIEDSDRFIPQLFPELDMEVISINARRPTLDDVFLKLTGRAVREESADALGMARAVVRARRMRGKV